MLLKILHHRTVENLFLSLTKILCSKKRSFSIQYNDACLSNVHQYFSSSDTDTLYHVAKSFSVFEDFVNEEEENNFMEEIDPIIRRRRYEYDHWDGAIQGYKETEKLNWNDRNSATIQRLRDLAFPPGTLQIKTVHVLDLAQSGHIKPHVDSIRFCGDTIAGISLLSSCVMRLKNEKDETKIVDVLLPQRSLYIMRGTARYNFTHEILEEKLSFFKGDPVIKNRRVSIICRNEPSNEDA